MNSQKASLIANTRTFYSSEVSNSGPELIDLDQDLDVVEQVTVVGQMVLCLHSHCLPFAAKCCSQQGLIALNSDMAHKS